MHRLIAQEIRNQAAFGNFRAANRRVFGNGESRGRGIGASRCGGPKSVICEASATRGETDTVGIGWSVMYNVSQAVVKSNRTAKLILYYIAMILIANGFLFLPSTNRKIPVYRRVCGRP